MGEDPGHDEARRPLLFVVGGGAVAGLAIGIAAADGPPYLSLEQLDLGLVVYAVALFVALFATPFAIHRRLGGVLEADARWERALLAWAAVAAGALAIGIVSGLPSGFGSDSLAGSLGLVTAVEAALVLGTLLVWLISG